MISDSGDQTYPSGEAARKFLHLLALTLPVFAWQVGGALAFKIIGPLALVMTLADILRTRVLFVNQLVDRLFGAMMRTAERPALGDSIRFNGATWVFLAFSLMLFVFETRVAVVAFIIFLVGDAAAAILGRAVGKYHWGRSGCTLEGSAAYLSFGLLAAVIVGGGGVLPGLLYVFPFGALFITALIAAATEMSPIPINDNLSAPVVSAIGLSAMMSISYGIPVAYFPLL